MSFPLSEQVHKTFDEEILRNIDPNIVSQPECSFETFCRIVKDIVSDFNKNDANMKKSGSHDVWLNFCHGEIRACACYKRE